MYGINHETVSKQLFIYPFAHHTDILLYSIVNKYCKSFGNMSSTAPIAEWLEGHAGNRGVAGSFPEEAYTIILNFALTSR